MFKRIASLLTLTCLWNSRKVLVFLLFFIFAGIISEMPVYALDPMPSKDTIPANIVGATKRDIEKLYSSDAIERANAAQRLGRQKAISAAPFLAGMLDDNARLSTGDIMRGATSPGIEAARSLIMMGKTDTVIAALKDKDFDVRFQAIKGLESSGKPVIEPLILALKSNNDETKKNIADILFRMTYQIYGGDYEKWRKWWDRNKDNYR